MKNYPDWVCQKCAIEAYSKTFQKAFEPKGASTWQEKVCDVCGKILFVTQPRDFYYPNFEGHKSRNIKIKDSYEAFSNMMKISLNTQQSCRSCCLHK